MGHSAQAQIFIDDFENGTDNTSVATGGRWLTVTGGSVAEGTLPNYQTENNPFPSGSLYARMYDPNNTAGPRLITSNTAGSDGRGSSITGHVTTFSFDFWEPNVLTQYNAGISFGYTSADDLNAGQRVWRAFLVDGMMNPTGANEGAAVAYPKETRNTVWMVANDTAAAIDNYRDGQTLDAGDADVWISVNGGAPTFAFALGRQAITVGTGPQGIGFRSFSGDIGEVLIDNVLLVDGATFDRGAFTPLPSLSLLVDPLNGQVRVENNTATSITFNSYRITSDEGSLNPGGWKSIAAPPTQSGFPIGNGTGNGWEKAPNANANELVEWYLTGNSTLNAGSFISLGQAFTPGAEDRDLMFEFQRSDGAVISAAVNYGNIPVASVAGDYNDNGIVDAADYVLWRNGGPLQNEGATPGQVTPDDYIFWRARFGATAGSGAGIGATLVPVPEPAVAELLLLASGMLVCCRHRLSSFRSR